MTAWNFYSAGQLVFGSGSVSMLGRLAQARKYRSVHVVTDAVLAKAGLVEKVTGPLQSAGIHVSVFDGGQPEPSLETARESVAAARRENPAAILGLGGGSNLDLAKMTSLLLAHGGEFSDYFGFDNVPGPVVPLICVPTTAGTGSEVSHAAVLTDTAAAMKVSTLSRHLRPDLAVVDAELTFSCPRQATADSGIDALTHAIEAYTATKYHDLPGRMTPGETCAYDGAHVLGDLLAEKAIRLIGEHLVASVKEPENRTAREGMALAATLAGLAFSNCGVALVHALEYPLGGELHVSHGAGNGLLLPFVMRFNLSERKKELSDIAKWLGWHVAGLAEEDQALAAVKAVESLKHEIGIPERIRDLGGSPDQLPGFAKKSYAISRLRWINPRPASEADLLEILESAW